MTTTTVLFGDIEAVQALQVSPEEFKDYAAENRGFSIIQRTFDTEAEKDAYWQGLRDSAAGFEAYSLDDNEAKELEEYID